MNKFLSISFLFFLSFLFFFSPSFAATTTNKLPEFSKRPSSITVTSSKTGDIESTVAKSGGTAGVFFSPIRVSEVKLEKDTYSAGDAVSGTISIQNYDTSDVADIYLNISLAGDYGTTSGRENIANIFYDTKTFGPFTAEKNKVTEIPFTYKLPEAYGGKGYGINVSVKSISGFPYGWGDAFLKEISGGMPTLILKEAYTDVDGKKYNANAGAMIESSTTATFHLKVTNPSIESITVTPNIEVHERLSSGKLIKKYSDKTITIPSKGSYEFILTPYNNENTPGVYVADVTLLDKESISRAPPVTYHYIVPGEIATIHSLKLSDNSVFKNEKENVTVSYSGSPFNPLTGLNKQIENAVINVKIFDANSNELIGESGTPARFEQDLNVAEILVEIAKGASSIVVVATIEKDGKVLATYTGSPTEPDLEKIKNVKKKRMIFYLIGAGIITLILACIFYIRKKKNGKALIGIVTLLIVAGAGFFMIENYVSASEVYYNVHFNRNSQGVDTPTSPWVSVVINPTDPWTLRDGSSSLSGSVSSVSCNCQYESLEIGSWIENTVSGNQSPYYYYYTDTVNQNTDLFNFVWPVSSVHQGSGSHFDHYPGNAGARNYILRVKDHWEDDANTYNHWGQINVRIPFTLYDAVAVNCIANRSTAAVGEEVVWRLYPSGGAGTYLTSWSGDEQDLVQQNNVLTLTKTYATAGTKQMYVYAEDPFTGSNSLLSSHAPSYYTKYGVTPSSYYFGTQYQCTGSYGGPHGVTITEPIVPPVPPDLTETVSCGGKVTLTWTATEGATYYYLYKNGINIYTVGYGYDRSYSETLTPEEGDPSYQVVAVISGINYPSNTEYETIDYTECPQPELNIETAACGGYVSLSWDAVSDLALYGIYENNSPIDNTYDNFYVHNTNPGSTNSYYVDAYDYYTGVNTPIGPKDATASGACLLPPTGFSASNGQCDKKINLSWNAADGATGYNIYRQNSVGEYQNVGSVTASPTTNETPLLDAEGTRYYYKISSYKTIPGSDTEESQLSDSINFVNTSQTECVPPDIKGAETISVAAECSKPAFPGLATSTVYLSWLPPSGVTGTIEYDVLRDGEEIATNISGGDTDLYYIDKGVNDTGFGPGGFTGLYKIKTRTSAGTHTSTGIKDDIIPANCSGTARNLSEIKTFIAEPPLINPFTDTHPGSGLCKISWEIEPASSLSYCTIIAPDGSNIHAFYGYNLTGSFRVAEVKKDSKFTISCVQNGVISKIKTATCKINPDYKEN